MAKFYPYPTLNEIVVKNINYKETQFVFKYNNEIQNSIDEIKIDESKDTIVFEDQNKNWFYKENNLIIEKEINFNPQKLFGLNGLVAKDSQLSLAVIWKSRKTMIKGIKKYSSFTVEQDNVAENIEITFGKNDLRDDVTIEIVIILEKNSAQPTYIEGKFANNPGSIVGVLETKKLIFVGDGSMFPVSIVELKDGPLWFLDIDFAFENLVEESICLKINKSHKKFHLLNKEDKEKFDEELLEEITINVVFQIMLEYNDKASLFEEDEYEEGTIGSLISYFIKAFEPNNSSISNLYKSLSKGIR